MKTKGEIDRKSASDGAVRDRPHGPGRKDAATYVVADRVVVRLKGVLTPAEQQLTKPPTVVSS
jgi:uncharacterized protein YbcI